MSPCPGRTRDSNTRHASQHPDALHRIVLEMSPRSFLVVAHGGLDFSCIRTLWPLGDIRGRVRWVGSRVLLWGDEGSCDDREVYVPMFVAALGLL